MNKEKHSFDHRKKLKRRFCQALLFGLLGIAPSALAFDFDYVTGGSINIGEGTSAVRYRKSSGSGDHALYMTFGGPSIKMSFPNNDFTVSASFFPSVRFLDDVDPNTNNFAVLLGFGPAFTYKDWILSFPFYFPGPAQTDMAITIGYKL